MRISTQSFYEQSRNAMGSQQSNLLRTQQQLGAGTKILTPSDDPLGATRALAVSQSIALNAQYAATRSHTAQTLTMEEKALQSVTTVLQNVKGLLIQAGGTLTDADCAAIATTLQSDLDQMQGLANTDDGNGQFLFAGFKSGTAPFVNDASGGISYAGDQGQRLTQVDTSRQMAGTDDGRSIFQTVQGGAGYISSAAGNVGSGVFSSISVIDAGDANFGKDFVISFSAGTPMSYQVDSATTPPVAIVAATSYAAGNPIKFGGLQISISGTPNAADRFSITTAKNAGTDVFLALRDVITTLKTPVDNAGPPGQAQVLNALSLANRKITNAHDNVLTVRASVGSRLQELDSLSVTGDSRALSDKTYLSDLQDLDYGSTIAEFYQRQTALQASQKTFLKIQEIALFKYL